MRHIYFSRSINVYLDRNRFSVAFPVDPSLTLGSITTWGIENLNDSENSNKRVIDKQMVYNQTML